VGILHDVAAASEHEAGAKGQDLRVLIVIPAYNEQGKVGLVVQKVLTQVTDTVLVVDDCSTDQTAMEAQTVGALVINHEHNLGVGGAIRTGIDYALAHDFQVVAVLSGDNQHDPAELPGLLRPILVEGYDFVQGSRRLQGLQSPNIRWFRRVFTWVYAITFRLLTGFTCTDATNGGRAFRTRIFLDGRINLWQEWLNSYELEPYLFYKVVRRDTKSPKPDEGHLSHERNNQDETGARLVRILRPIVYLAGVEKIAE
jgi:dolichol-phosphate mannosyltransferase